MYYSINCTEIDEKQKLAFAAEIHEQLGLPVSDTHVAGSDPFIQLNRFGNDVTISRMTRLPDLQTVADTMEKVADQFFPERLTQ